MLSRFDLIFGNGLCLRVLPYSGEVWLGAWGRVLKLAGFRVRLTLSDLAAPLPERDWL